MLAVAHQACFNLSMVHACLMFMTCTTCNFVVVSFRIKVYLCTSRFIVKSDDWSVVYVSNKPGYKPADPFPVDTSGNYLDDMGPMVEVPPPPPKKKKKKK